MSGHNKWSKIKRQKGVEDAKKGNLYTKLTREIIIAAREGGGDSETNFKLRLAIQKARDSSMPKDNIERAIERGSGTQDGAALQELMLEGYGHIVDFFTALPWWRLEPNNDFFETRRTSVVDTAHEPCRVEGQVLYQP